MFKTVVLSKVSRSSAWWGGGCRLSSREPASFLCSSICGWLLYPTSLGVWGGEGALSSFCLFASVLWASPVKQSVLLPKQLELPSLPLLASAMPVLEETTGPWLGEGRSRIREWYRLPTHLDPGRLGQGGAVLWG